MSQPMCYMWWANLTPHPIRQPYHGVIALLRQRSSPEVVKTIEEVYALAGIVHFNNSILMSEQVFTELSKENPTWQK